MSGSVFAPFSGSVAVSIDANGDRDGEISLGDPIRFSWIDVMGIPPVEISGFRIECGGPDDAVVLVDRSTLELMAIAFEAAELVDSESSHSSAVALLACPVVALGPMGALHDVTDWFGGAAGWADQMVDPAAEPFGAGSVLELVRRFAGREA